MQLTAKRWLAIVSICICSQFSFATTPGSYAGAGIGYSKLDTNDQPVFFESGATKFTQQMGGLGWRGFGGYNINSYFGIEAGFADYAPSKYHGQALLAHTSLQYSMSVFDVVGKSYFPIGQTGFDLYALMGAAGTIDKVEAINGPLNDTNQYHKIRPKVGIGMNYAIPQSNVTTGIEFTHIEGLGNTNTNPHAVPSANAVTLNFTVSF